MASKVNIIASDKTIVLNDLLFFVINKIDIINNALIIERCVEYYSCSLITESKDLILGDSSKLFETKEKKIRKPPGSKPSPKNDLKEIVNIIKLLKEKNLMDKMPLYLAGNFNFPDIADVNKVNVNNSGTTNIDISDKLNAMCDKIDNLANMLNNFV